jgi:maltose-binding protein MalE
MRNLYLVLVITCTILVTGLTGCLKGEEPDETTPTSQASVTMQVPVGETPTKTPSKTLQSTSLPYPTSATPYPGLETQLPGSPQIQSSPSPTTESTQVSATGTSPTPSGSITPTERPIATVQPAPPSEAVTVTVWHSWEAGETLLLQFLLETFQGFYPNVYFNLLYVPFDELQIKYEAALNAGEGPSLLLGPAEWGADFYNKRLVTDLAPLASQAFLSQINPAALVESSYKGAIVSLPYAIRRGVILYRNTQIISKAPTSFDELVNLAQDATHGGIVGAYLDRGFYYSGAHLFGLGGRLMDDDGIPSFNDQHGVKWLNLLLSFEQAGATEYNGDRDLELFRSGRVGMIIDGTWNMETIAEALGEDHVAIDPWPKYDGGQLSGFIQTDNLYLNPDISEKERYAALQFMAFLLAREVQETLAQNGKIPAVINLNTQDPLLKQALYALEEGSPFPIQPEMTAYWAPLEDLFKSTFDENVDPAVALQKAYDTIITTLNR